jgi:plastocyanin
MKTVLPASLIIASLLFGYPYAYAGSKEPEVVIVKIGLLQFNPEEVAVKPGTTIRWMNEDPVDHDITSGISITGRKARGKEKVKIPDGKFQSGLFPAGKTFEVTLTEKGDYPYFCNIHPFMVGKIKVG